MEILGQTISSPTTIMADGIVLEGYIDSSDFRRSEDQMQMQIGLGTAVVGMSLDHSVTFDNIAIVGTSLFKQLTTMLNYKQKLSTADFNALQISELKFITPTSYNGEDNTVEKVFYNVFVQNFNGKLYATESNEIGNLSKFTFNLKAAQYQVRVTG